MLPKGFWEKIDVRGDDECWEWLAHRCGGYGHIRVGDKVKKAHRLSYIATNGPIPNGLLVMHTCDNRGCVNPKHLRIGTAKDNNRDRDEKGRHIALNGEKHGMSKLTYEAVEKIRNMRKRHHTEEKQLAKKLGISVIEFPIAS